MENSPRKLGEFLDDARPDRERLRVLAQALAGAALSGKSEEEKAKLVATTPAEQSALGKLLANWKSLIESRAAAGEGGFVWEEQMNRPDFSRVRRSLYERRNAYVASEMKKDEAARQSRSRAPPTTNSSAC